MSAESPEASVYLILGAAGSGRREILCDLLEGGLEPSERAAVLVCEDEPPSEASSRLSQRAVIVPWKLTDIGPAEVAIEAKAPEEAAKSFFLTSGKSNPVDQIEAFHAWLGANHLGLARVLCVIDCRLAAAHPPLVAWFEACIHFADVVLMTHRDGVSNKWISAFQARFKQKHFPCLFEFVKNGAVQNPALILEPQPLRISHVFDEEPEWVVLDEDKEEDAGEGEEEVEVGVEVDPYFERLNGGRRVRELPDIAKFLSPTFGV